MKALALGVLVSFAAFAADPLPADAPLAETPVVEAPAEAPTVEPVTETQIVNVGETTLVTGPALVVPSKTAVRLAQRISMAESERDALRAEVSKTTPSWVVPVVAIAAFLAGGAVGVSAGIAYANAHPK